MKNFFLHQWLCNDEAIFIQIIIIFKALFCRYEISILKVQKLSNRILFYCLEPPSFFKSFYSYFSQNNPKRNREK